MLTLTCPPAHWPTCRLPVPKRPLHLRGPSPSQGVAPALIIGAVAGGPIGLVAIGGVAAVAGAELLGTRAGGMPISLTVAIAHAAIVHGISFASTDLWLTSVFCSES